MIKTALADPERTSSSEQVEEDDIVWDFVAVYEPGARWEPQERMPESSYYGYPVVHVIEEVQRTLEGKRVDPSPSSRPR